MTDFYKKNRKKLIFVTFLFLLFFGVAWNIKYNLPKTVEVVVRLFVGPTFKSSSIEFEKEKIVIKDFILADGEEVIIDTPKVEILYSKDILKRKRIDEIIIDGGTANITRRKNGDINIVAAFTGESEPEEEKKEKPKDEKYEPGIGIPIDKITGINVTTVFRDLGYRLPIEETAYNTNGYLTFSESEGINLHFIGSNKEQVYDFAFSTSKEPYSMTIKLKDIDVKTELVQYGYDGKEVSYNGGKLNMDLTIASSGMLGWINFDGVNVKYIDLDDEVKNVTGKVEFTKEGIFLNAIGKVFEKPEKFTLSYKDNELNIDFKLKDIKQKDLEKLSYLDGVELPFKNLVVNDVKFNLNLKNELKINIDAFVKRAELEQLRLNDTQVKLIYDKSGIHLPIISTDLATLDKEKNVGIEEKITGTFDLIDKRGMLKFKVENVNNKSYIPNINGDLNFDILEDQIAIVLDSNIIDLEGKYFTKEKKIQLDKKNQYFLEYSLADKKFSDGKGRIGLNIFDLDIIFDYAIDKNRFLLNEASIINGKKKELELTGEIDLENSSYAFNMDGQNLDIKRKLGEEEFWIKGKILGTLKSENGKFNGDLDIHSLYLKYLGEVQNIHGKVLLNNKNNLFFEYQGEIDKLSYENYSLNGVIVSLRLKDDIFEIKNFNNQLLTINGSYDLKTSKLKGKLETNGLSLERFNIDFPKIKLNKVTASIDGNLENPIGKISISDVGISFKNEEEIKITGEINYKDKVVTTNNVKINQNILKARYSVKDGKYRAKLNILEENIGRYYNYENLKYRVIGTVVAEGENKKLKVGLKSTVDKVYMNGMIFPTAYIEADYSAENLNDGIVKLKNLTFSNQNLQDLFTVTGSYDLPNNFLEVKVDKQELPLAKLKDYIPIDGVEGKLYLEGKLLGELDDLNYNFSILSSEIDVKKVKFNTIRVFLSGDMKEVKLDELSFKYLHNKFSSDGEYNITENRYRYYAKSSNIDLDFLNVFLEPYNISDIRGNAEFDLKITDSRNDGFIKIKNLNLEKKDFFLKLQEFNSTIGLENNKISIKDFSGKLNDGDLGVKGEIIFPTLKDISDNPYYYENIKYNGNLKLNGIKYRYGDYFNVDFSANIGIREKDIRGNIEIEKGLVSEIPNTSKSIFQKIKEFLFSSTSKTINQSEDLGSDFKIESIIENAPSIDVRIKINEGIKLDIGDINGLVEDIKGNVIGNGVLSGKNGKYTFIGNTEVLGGSFNLNDNTFYLDRAVVIFNDPKSYLPKVNPNLLIDARVLVQDDQIGLSLNGNLDNLKFTISSRNGSSSGNLNSLLTDTDSFGENNEATTTLITNVIGGQITQVLKPIANLVKHTLNISKFRISSNLLTQNTKNSSNNNDDKSQSSLKLGAVLEAEDNIYKDKIWWVAKGTLLEEDNTGNNKQEESNGAFKEYDFSLEYRFDAVKSIGVGVGKLPENRKKTSDKESKENLNYHIDFKFEKKYDKLIDIFINK